MIDINGVVSAVDCQELSVTPESHCQQSAGSYGVRCVTPKPTRVTSHFPQLDLLHSDDPISATLGDRKSINN
jgi:hypothetical protein